MKISELVNLSGNSICAFQGLAFEDSDILSIEYDSRKVVPGSLFVAVAGLESDGHDYAGDAVEMGCAALVVSADRADEFRKYAEKGIALLLSDDTRKSLSRLSSVFCGNPSRKLHVTGVTGTNGKTSITYLLESVFAESGINCAVMGTINYRWQGRTVEAPNTTPESREIQYMLKQMADDGVTHVIMEVSSHALELNRVDDVEFDIAVFTNLTGDHIDFHKTMDKYFEAKRKLFYLLNASPKSGKTAVVNTDDSYGKVIAADCAEMNFNTVTFGFSENDGIRISEDSVKNKITGLSFDFHDSGIKRSLNLKLAGKFQAQNSIAAWASAINAGLDADAVCGGLEKLESVPGRLQVLDPGKGFFMVVDYAHTPDALLKLLQSAREMDHNRIITVFGCGGDRDKTKRPVMGGIAADNSDFAIVTSDNPRTEDPEIIIEEIIAGIKKENYMAESDRERAIEKAVNMAQADDIIVIAGKGHEDYQIIGKTKRHFDDREIALKYAYMRELN
jgi:UDP-N-acetylmuramoyl-L-alanyl-D-glutamate--2,6-diaminopimelate ligase